MSGRLDRWPMVAVLLLALSAVQLAAGWSTATQQVAVGGPKIAFQEGSVTVSVPGPRPPVLFMLLTSKDGKEKIGVQLWVVIPRPVWTDCGRKRPLGPSKQEALEVKATGSAPHLWEMRYRFTCLRPGRFQAVVFCEQSGSNTGRFPPHATWINDSFVTSDRPRGARARQELFTLPAYSKGGVSVMFHAVKKFGVDCKTNLPVVPSSASNLFPRHGGSWIKGRDLIPDPPIYPWISAKGGQWFRRGPKPPKSRGGKGRYTTTRRWFFEPHDLLQGRPIQPYHRGVPATDMMNRALGRQPVFVPFLGDSVMRIIWHAFVSTCPMLMAEMESAFGGGKGAMAVFGPRANTLLQEFMTISHERYSNLTRFAQEVGAGSELFLRAGRPPTHVVVGAGLWDAQSRPPSEFERYLPILISSLKQVFPGAEIIWVIMPPVDTAQLRAEGITYRTNEWLLAAGQIAKQQLIGMEGVTVVDVFAIMSAQRSTTRDGRHYTPEYSYDVADVLWNIILHDDSSE